MDPAVRIYDSVKLSAHFMILLKTIRNLYSMKGLKNSMGYSQFPLFWYSYRTIDLSVYISPEGGYPHITFAFGTTAFMDGFDKGLIYLVDIVFQEALYADTHT